MPISKNPINDKDFLAKKTKEGNADLCAKEKVSNNSIDFLITNPKFTFDDIVLEKIKLEEINNAINKYLGKYIC